MAALCISRDPTTSTLYNKHIYFPHVTVFDRLRLRETHLRPKKKTEDRFDMSLTLRMGADAYGSTAPTGALELLVRTPGLILLKRMNLEILSAQGTKIGIVYHNPHSLRTLIQTSKL